MNANATIASSETKERATVASRILSALAPLIILAIFSAGFAWFVGWPKWPVADAGERIAYSAIGATVFAIIASLVSCCWIRLPLNLLAATTCVLPSMWAEYQNETWTAGQLALWASVVTVGVALAASLNQQLRDNDRSPLVSLVTLGMTLSGGGLLMATGSLKLGQAGFALAAGVLVVFIVGVFVKSIGKSAGATTLAIAVLGGLLVSGYCWSELPWYSGVCVLIAPALAWVVRIPIVARRPVWQRVVLGLLFAAVPATVVTTIAAVKAQHAAASMDEYGY